MEHTLILQQLIKGETTQEVINGKPVYRRKWAAIMFNPETNDTFTVPWDPRTERPIITIRTLAKLDSNLAEEAQNALRRAPRQKVKR